MKSTSRDVISALLLFIVVCHQCHQTESASTEGTTEVTSLSSTAAVSNAKESTTEAGTSNTTSIYTSDPGLHADNKLQSSRDVDNNGNPQTVSTGANVVQSPVETCTAQRLLPLTILLSFLAGMLVVAVPACLFIRRIWCFYTASDRGSSGPSDRATDKVLRQLTLERLNEIERKQRKKQQLEASISHDELTLRDKGPDIVITELNGRNSYEKLDSMISSGNSEKPDEREYHELSFESKKKCEDTKEDDEHEKTPSESTPIEATDEIKILVTKDTADSPVVFTRRMKQSVKSEAKQTIPLSDKQLNEHARETSLSGKQLYEHARETSLPGKQLYEHARETSLSDKQLSENARESSLSDKQFYENVPESSLSNKQLYEHARESVISAGDWNGLLALQNENFRDSNQLSQLF